ncbi:hypothetical protein JXL19_05100 [bacterium]|nr:hypothetical protein [bacterium]
MDETIGTTSFCSTEETSDGGFILAGSLEIYLRNEGWIQYGMMMDSIALTQDVGYIIAGLGTKTFFCGGGGIEDGESLIIRIDGDGEILWQNVYGTDDHDIFLSLQKTSDGGYIAAGQTDSFSSSEFRDAWILKIDADGSCTGCSQ